MMYPCLEIIKFLTNDAYLSPFLALHTTLLYFEFMCLLSSFVLNMLKLLKNFLDIKCLIKQFPFSSSETKTPSSTETYS